MVLFQIKSEDFLQSGMQVLGIDDIVYLVVCLSD